MRLRSVTTQKRKRNHAGLALVAAAVLLALLFSTLLMLSPVFAQEEGRYYPETGHTIDGQFVALFDQQGGLEILGYPITDAFVDPLTGWLIQYFQNARMEMAIDPATGEMVPVLSPLGEWMNGWDAAIRKRDMDSNGCEFFKDSSHSVCYAFLEFYESHGGLHTFGLPVSEFKLVGDHLVQYFQGYRLDWLPDEENQVRAAPLGRIHFDQVGYDRNLLDPVLPNNRILYRVMDMQLKSSVAKPVMISSDEQEVYLLVRDQNLHPVQGAAVTMFVQMPDGLRTLVMPITDSQGISRLKLPQEEIQPGTVVTLEFWVVYGQLIRMTQDSFMVWW